MDQTGTAIGRGKIWKKKKEAAIDLPRLSSGFPPSLNPGLNRGTAVTQYQIRPKFFI
jgi:hypothetical protein